VELHPGLVIIIPGALGREMQLEFFRRVLDVVEPMADLVNKVIEVFSDGSVDLRDWPEQRPNPNAPANF
jgi:hypothetical protein